MIGRAGRAGFDTHGESILIVRPSEMPFVTQDILLAPIEHVRSQLAEDGLQGLQQLILSLISLDLCGKERLTLCKTLGRSTLLGLQVNICFRNQSINNRVSFTYRILIRRPSLYWSSSTRVSDLY